MIAFTPQLVLLTTGVGALMILLGLGRGLLQARTLCPPLFLVGPSDRGPRLQDLHKERPLILRSISH